MVAVVVALMMLVLLGVVAFAADGGLLLAHRRSTQAAADTAALSGAADLLANWTTPGHSGFDPDGTASSCALSVAAANGYSNDGTTSIVTVNGPGGTYSGGPNAGKAIPAGYVEVVIQYNQPRIFAAVFGTNPIPVKARSVARSQWIFAPPIVVLDRSADFALLMGSGNGVVNVPNGPVFVNSTSSVAMSDQSAGVMLAPQYNVTGKATSGFIYAPNPNYPASGYLRTGTNPIADPLSYIPAPDPSSLKIQAKPAPVGGVYTLNPGRYVGGLSFTDGNDVVMNPGVYYMDGGGFTFNNVGVTKPASLTGATVMIYNGGSTPGNVTIRGNGAVTLGPLPSSYALAQGLTIFQDRSSTNTVLIKHTSAANNYNITGAIYAANAFVQVFRQNKDPNVGSQFIVRTLELDGTGDMSITGGFVYTRALGGVE
jgi:hypothetical protein